MDSKGLARDVIRTGSLSEARFTPVNVFYLTYILSNALRRFT